MTLTYRCAHCPLNLGDPEGYDFVAWLAFVINHLAARHQLVRTSEEEISRRDVEAVWRGA